MSADECLFAFHYVGIFDSLLTGTIQGMNEKHLLHYLFVKNNYNALERPVDNESKPIVVRFGITLQQIIDVDEKNQILHSNIWLQMYWRDVNLVWDPKEFGGVEEIRVPAKKVWKPDILVYNSADDDFDGTFHTNVIINYDGRCKWLPPGMFKSTCQIDIRWFPFDEQRCILKFGSWTYDGRYLDLVFDDKEEGDTSDFIRNGEWELIGVPGVRNEKTYECCPEIYIDITFTVHIQRRTLYYGFNIIIPCVLISSMSLLLFMLPPDSGEKISLGVTILLSLMVFLLLVAETMPPTSDAVPLIGLGSEDEVRLVRDLFERGYNPLIRPVKNISESIEVQFNLALSQLISVDEKNQVMKTNVWLQMYWNDYQLQWNPKDYGGISTIRISHNKAWRPDIVLFNNADGTYEVSYESNVVIGSSSLIYWVPPAIYKSSCTIDVKYFPFDEQICEMHFGSWTFDINQLHFSFYENMRALDLTDYLKSGTWDIIEFPVDIVNHTDLSKNETKSIYIAKFKLRRKTLFYLVNLIIPCVLISLVSVCVFALPADAGEKITLCISILLALVVFLLLISRSLPPALTIPLISKFLLFTFIINIIAIGSTVFVINQNFRTPRTHDMPVWIRTIFLKHLPTILLMRRPNHIERYHATDKKKEKEECAENENKSEMNQLCKNLLEEHLKNCEIHNSTKDLSSAAVLQTESLDPTYQRAVNAIRFIKTHLKKEDEYDTVIDDWKYVASVLDRLLLVVFLTVTLSGTFGIFFQAPYIFDHIDQDEIIANADGNYEVTYEPNVVLVMDKNSDYNIYQIPPAIFKSSCEIDVKYFPFDEQVCEMKFGSWTFQADQLNFTYTKFRGLDLTDYLKSGTWDLVDCPARIEICADENTKQAKALYIAQFLFVINRNYRTARTHRMPKWTRVVFLNYLPRILFMKRPNHDDRWQKSNMSDITASKSSLDAHSRLDFDINDVQDDWKYVALVIDRLLLYIFLLVTVCGTLAILFQSPFILMNVDQDTQIEHLKLKYNLSITGKPAGPIPIRIAPC
ncbi:hypothetical protein FSP39_016756 [Pinctada imbricata]|uniref:Uncharacterized protein n=1 Tax=Pinctada imbricata TaxID=66713 RepID=A0AA89C1I8_PINIB|nr:hypothetical protein FSP39_016756 [Pinctada imbricata]